MAIGCIIRARGFNTYVDRNDTCFSACGLIWLAGVKRYASASGAIGFHDVCAIDKGVSQVSASGNALAGAYMSRLGLSDIAIDHLTAADPDERRLLTFRDAAVLGIEEILFEVP